MVICLERSAQLMPLPLTVSCFSKIQTGFTFLVLVHPGSPGKRAVERVCVVCVCVCPFTWCLYVNQAAHVNLILTNKNDDDVGNNPYTLWPQNMIV